MMTAQQVMNARLEYMTEDELRYVISYCDNEVRRLVHSSPRMDLFESRRKMAEQELDRLRNL